MPVLFKELPNGEIIYTGNSRYKGTPVEKIAQLHPTYAIWTWKHNTIGLPGDLLDRIYEILKHVGIAPVKEKEGKRTKKSKKL
jgi:hypothetical protein